ncbi:MAG: DUF1800 domain-containing protein, partial [Mucilaginibacter sp.]
LALTSGQIAGVKVNLGAFNQATDPQNTQAAIVTYSKLLLPGQNPDHTVQELSPLLNNPNLAAKVNDAPRPAATAVSEKPTVGATGDMMLMSVPDNKPKPATTEQPKVTAAIKPNNNMQALIAGIIIGSPEFQRR